MKLLERLDNLIKLLAEHIHNRKRAVLALACLVVFVTTYTLILPAFTLGKTTAAQQGGIDVPGVTETTTEVTEETTEEATEEVPAEETTEETAEAAETEVTEEAQAEEQPQEAAEEGKTEEPASEAVTEEKNTEKAEEPATDETDPLKFEGEKYTIAVVDNDSVLPENTSIKVKEIDKSDNADAYEQHFNDALEAVQKEKDGENVSDFEFARFYDISLVSDGNEVSLSDGDKVSVNIEYDKELRKALGVEDKNNIRIIHFAENKSTGEVTAEVLDNKDAKVEVNTDSKDQLKEASFEAESFSVYAVVYTVDFEYEDEATHEVFTYSMEGGSSITLKKLAVILGITTKAEADEFIANVEDVKFSDEKLVKVEKTDDGWTLNSLKAFDTTETLTITMKDGSEYDVKVTDATAVPETNVNIAPFITDATLDIDGKTYGAGETWKVRPDVDYKLTLTFTEKGSRQLPPGGSTLVMDLPAGLTLEPGASGTFDIPCGLAGTVTGNTWTVGSDNKLHIQLGDDPEDLITRSSNVHINLELDAKFDGTHTEFEFNDKVKREVEYDNSASASITKSGHYNASTNKMEYTLSVKSTGKTENVKITDAISGDMLSLDENSIVIVPANKTVTNKSTNAKGFELTISEMSHNETVTINYTASVDLSKVGPGGTVTAQDGTNTVTVKPGNGDGDNDTNIVNTIKYSSISKSSTGQSEVEGQKKVKLDWTIVANKGSRGSLAGSSITDKIDYNSKDVMKYESNPLSLEIKVYDQNGTFIETRTASVDVSDNQGQESWKYVIPETDKSHNYYYEISYSTIADQQKENTSVKNNAENESDGTSSGSGIVPGTNPGGGGDDPVPSIVTEKTAKKVTTDYIDWDIVINVPAEGFPDGLTVVDDVPHSGKYADSFDSILSVTGLVNNETYSFNPVSTDLDENGNVDWDLRHAGKTRDVVTIDFFQNQAKTDKGLDAQARTITITIRTLNDKDWMAYAEKRGGGDPAYYHWNNAKVNDTKIKNYGIPLNSSIEKTSDNKNSATTIEKDGVQVPVYEYSLTLTNVTDLPLVINDTFDTELMEYYGPGDPSSGHNTIAAAEQKHELNGGVDGYSATFEQTDNGLVITANDLPKKQDGSFYEYYRLYYKLNVRPDKLADLKRLAYNNGGVYKLSNDVMWDTIPGHYDIEYKVPGLTKEGYFSKAAPDRMYTFLIDVNPEKFEMNGGQPMELSDSHTDNLSVDYTSIKVYKITDGKIETNPRNYNLNDYEAVTGEVTWDFSGNTGTFTVPDNTHYLIVYNALVIGSDKQDISNVAEMKGFSSTKTDSRDFGSDSGAGGDVMQVKLLKHMEGQTSEGLEGTTFQLFRGTGEYTRNEDGSYKDEIKEPMKYGDTKYTRGEEAYDNREYSFDTHGANVVGHNITFTTNSEGWVTIALNQSVHGEMLEEGVHYYLKEIDSPPGYQIDSSVEYWEFTLTKDPDGVSYGTTRDPVTGWRQWIYFYYNDILKMSNTPTTNPLDVNVDKQWFDENGVEITDDRLNDLEATIQLMRKKNDEEYKKVKVTYGADGTPVIEEVSDESGVVTLDNSNNWEYSWNDLPRVDGNDKYAYKIEEVNVSGYVVDMTETEDETSKTYSLKNYKVPEDRTTDISVEKKWQDFEGNDLEGTEENIPEMIHYYLYQVVSSTPFTTAPKTGGSIYVIPNDDRLVDRTATDADDNYGIYYMTKGSSEPYWSTTFENLPEVVTDSSGNTLFYAYYIKEVKDNVIKDYTTTYEQNGTTRTVINREPRPEGNYIDIGLEKKWTDGTSTNPPAGASATFTVHQQKAEKEEGPSGDYEVVLYDADEKTILSQTRANLGDSVTLSCVTNSEASTNIDVYQYRPDWGDWYGYTYKDNIGGAGEISKSISITQSDVVNNKVQLKIEDSNFCNKCEQVPTLTADSTTPSYSGYEDTSFSKQIMLPINGSWSTTIDNLVQQDAEGNLYRYYITEDSSTPSSSNVTFVDENGADIKDSSGNRTVPISDKDKTVKVTNTVASGSLKVKKVVTLNDGPNGTSTLTDGTYTFHIAASGAETTPLHTVTIKYAGGTVTEAKLDGNDISPDDAGYYEVSGLAAGDYVISEDATTNGTILKSIDGGKSKDVNNRKVTVTVEEGKSGSTVADTGKAVFTNDMATVKAKVLKVWDDHNNTGTPASLTVTLSNGHTEVLTAENNWTATVDNLPKYAHDGTELQYEWTEGTITGYKLLSSETEVIEEDGFTTYFTTLTNTNEEHYNPKTSFSGTKIWNDDGKDRPDSIIVVLYKGEGTNKTEVARETINAPESGSDSWHYEFTNIPIFDENGNAIVYSVEEILPAGYEDKYLSTVDTESQQIPSYVRDPDNDTIHVKEECSDKIINTGVNLGFIVVKQGNSFVIWTPRKASQDELDTIASKVANQHGEVGDNEFSQILKKGYRNAWGVPPSEPLSVHNNPIYLTMDGDNVIITLTNWSQLAWGQLAYNYTPGITNIINTPIKTDFEFFKEWKDSATNIAWPKNGTDNVNIEVEIGRTYKQNGQDVDDSTFSLKYTIGTNLPTSGSASIEPDGTASTPLLIANVGTENPPTYEFKIENLDKIRHIEGQEDLEYTYYVKETSVPEPYKLSGYKKGEMTVDPTGSIGDGGTIINTSDSSYELPHTGGIGTTIFYILGSILVIGGGIYFVSRRRVMR